MAGDFVLLLDFCNACLLDRWGRRMIYKPTDDHPHKQRQQEEQAVYSGKTRLRSSRQALG